ncbi:Sulfate transporter/antisigma-factor antagonist STAS [Desulfovibrio sp. X2]|uniref:STAS domain-containing protein n=1 Tax=Desulfovibrio sp. X2 TaxID=941449 RepID=UPI000358F44E|nr:STAS domain-containing protein [Desulfovibrio sp. X2]EPR44241.1 Sulfate transporter/antisigma-factor antagonist STAS [Desulfovibrio sp. X2]
MNGATAPVSDLLAARWRRLLADFGSGVAEIGASPKELDSGRLGNLLRSAHTLAAVAERFWPGLVVAELAREAEGVLLALRSRTLPFSEAVQGALVHAFDALSLLASEDGAGPAREGRTRQAASSVARELAGLLPHGAAERRILVADGPEGAVFQSDEMLLAAALRGGKSFYHISLTPSGLVDPPEEADGLVCDVLAALAGAGCVLGSRLDEPDEAGAPRVFSALVGSFVDAEILGMLTGVPTEQVRRLPGLVAPSGPGFSHPPSGQAPAQAPAQSGTGEVDSGEEDSAAADAAREEHAMSEKETGRAAAAASEPESAAGGTEADEIPSDETPLDQLPGPFVVRRADGQVVCELGESATVAEAAALCAALLACVAQGSEVRLDAARLSRIDVTFVQLVAAAQKSLQEKGGSIGFLAPPSEAVSAELTSLGLACFPEVVCESDL